MSKSVYFISDGNGRIKIGCSETPERRMASLQTGSSLKLTLVCVLPGAEDLERALHQKFVTHRQSGEWFFAHEDILRFINAVGSQHQDPARAKVSSALAEFFREMHPNTPAVYVAARTGIPIRTIEKWLSREGLPSFDAAIALVRSYGPAILTALLGGMDHAPKWLIAAHIAERHTDRARILAEIALLDERESE